MTKEGYVPLTLIASFNRVRSLCDDIYLIADVRLRPITSLCSRRNVLIYLGSTRQFGYRSE